MILKGLFLNNYQPILVLKEVKSILLINDLSIIAGNIVVKELHELVDLKKWKGITYFMEYSLKLLHFIEFFIL